MILMETGRSVCTSIKLYIVASIVVIHDAAKERTIGILIRVARYGKSILVCQIQIGERRQRHIIGRCRHRLIRIDIVLITDHGIEIMDLAKGFGVCCDKLFLQGLGITALLAQ